MNRHISQVENDPLLCRLLSHWTARGNCRKDLLFLKAPQAVAGFRQCKSDFLCMKVCEMGCCFDCQLGAEAQWQEKGEMERLRVVVGREDKKRRRHEKTREIDRKSVV